MKYKTIGLTGYRGILGKEIIKQFKNVKIIPYKDDIRDTQKIKYWLLKNNFDAIIHLAAIVSTSEVLNDKKKAKIVNYNSTKKLINEIINLKKKDIWFFYASTSHVYNFTDKKIKESQLCKPINYYGYTKYLSEKYLTSKKDMNICIGRIFSFSSKRQKENFFIPSVIKKLKDKESKIVEFDNVNQVRDFLTIEEIVKAIQVLYNKKKKGIFNICSSKKVKLSDIIIELNKYFRKKILIKSQNKKNLMLVGDNKKIKNAGWQIKNNNYLKRLNKIFLKP